MRVNEGFVHISSSLNVWAIVSDASKFVIIMAMAAIGLNTNLKSMLSSGYTSN
ncbi:MAG TPA: putative sulfate exporter family transporter, partial [Candidatus Bathyarchaeia archaeon]|nr:putative sulfate exporter family transporter [Candidatus Bathyarchaeia archaeon]